MEVTILFPCLNEEKTVAVCIRQAASFLTRQKIEGEILVCDNGSTDQSVARAKKAGARVVVCKERGYGNALRFGIEHAQGDYVIMGDCDCSYHFDQLEEWMEELRQGKDLVIGNRFAVLAEKGAMPILHRYLGVPLLSALGRYCFQTKVRDFHCGLRAVKRSSFLSLHCRYGGMEFATEMIGRAAQEGQRIGQLPVKLHQDQRGRPSHLRSVRDGLRHLKVILTRCSCDYF